MQLRYMHASAPLAGQGGTLNTLKSDRKIQYQYPAVELHGEALRLQCKVAFNAVAVCNLRQLGLEQLL